MNLHFISGLPRSGSTLFGALLRQNPRFYHEGMSSPLAQIVMRVQNAISRGSEGAVLMTDAQRERVVRGLFANYYGSAVGKAEVVFDTNRAWTAKMPLLAGLFPDAKVICMVRDVSWIMNSIEKLIMANPIELSGIFGYDAGTNVFSRINGLASPQGMVGYAINALREAYCGPFADRLLLVDYEALVKSPAATLKVVYEFLGEDEFEHDFENFEYEAADFDASLGTPGLHRVSGPVEWREQATVLPAELFERFTGDAFWRDQRYNIRRVPAVLYQAPTQSNRPRRVGAGG